MKTPRTLALRTAGPLWPSTESMIVSWPTNATGFTLQSTPSLTPPVTWNDVTNQPTVLGGLITVTNPISSAAEFFRLRMP